MSENQCWIAYLWLLRCGENFFFRDLWKNHKFGEFSFEKTEEWGGGKGEMKNFNDGGAGTQKSFWKIYRFHSGVFPKLLVSNLFPPSFHLLFPIYIAHHRQFSFVFFFSFTTSRFFFFFLFLNRFLIREFLSLDRLLYFNLFTIFFFSGNSVFQFRFFFFFFFFLKIQRLLKRTFLV